MSQKTTLYESIHQQREVERRIYQRIMLTGYFNEEEIKRENISPEQYIKDSLNGFRQVKSYSYIKGVFYVQLLQSQSIIHINRYLQSFQEKLTQQPSLMNMNRVIHQSYENTQPFFKGTDIDNNPQSGPILYQTQKTEEQIQDRSFEIYQLFMEGARMRMENPSHRIGNMIVLSNEDMSMLNCGQFMSLQEYLQIYTEQMNIERQLESNYPLPPSFFDVMEFFQIEQYESYKK